MPRSSTPSALGGLRIADFSRVLAGPFATMLLADLGAEVIKIERPLTGDDTRSWGPPWDAGGTSTYFDSINRNKRSVVLDLGSAAGLGRARDLALSADVVVENFRPGLMDELGLGYERLREANPRVIFCSITGFGSQPAARHLPGYDLLVQALGGLMSITGAPDGPPQKVGVAVVDVLAGLFATVGILAAAVHRAESGRGQRIEVDLLSSLLAALVNQSAGYTAAGVVPARMGNRHPSVAPYEVLECGQGELVLAVGNDRQFAALCRVLDLDRLAGEGRFATNSARVANREALVEILERALAAAPAAEWAQRLTAARVPAGVVNDIAGAFALAQAIGLDPIVTLAAEDEPAGDGAGGRAEVRLPRNPIRLSETPAAYRLPPPRLPGAGAGYGLSQVPFFGHKSRREREWEEVQTSARDDLVALGDDIRALDVDVSMPGASEEVKQRYDQALQAYQRASEIFDRARRPEDLAPVSQTLEEGRYAIACTKALLEGRPLPERRPPCFFDPRHGPSAEDVQWAPPGGVPRPVPACAADALRIKEGFAPHSRQVPVGGRMVDYWNAPRHYGPWAGGYFGGFGGGLLSSLLMGSALGAGLGLGEDLVGGLFGGDGDGGWGDGDGGFGDFGDGGGDLF